MTAEAFAVSAAGAGTTPTARIGPNAVLQTLAAVEASEGRPVAQAVARDAGLPSDWPEGLIPEAWFLAVVEATRRRLGRARAEAVLADAGARTARYVRAHRIPALFRALLRALPARLAVPLLLAAFRRHAWTFAGSGRFRVEGRYPGTLVLDDCPTCRSHDPTSGGAYYAAAFENLLASACARARVDEVTCRAQGADACRFRVGFEHAHPI